MRASIRPLLRALCVALVSLGFLSLPAAAVETHRLRVANRVDGPVEVSLDRGLSYQRIGRVTRPATQNADGPERAGAVPAGSVALVGAGRVWVRAGAEGVRIFGLHARGGSAPPWVIATDLLPGSSAFSALMPPLGSRVFLQAAGKSAAARGLRDLPAGYVPTRDDVLVFVAALKGEGGLSRELPRVIQWENRPGGRVTAIGDGGERVIATVRTPVRGVGRYDATATVAPGRVAEHHAEGLLISTAGPAGDAASAVGGFRIRSAGGEEREDPTLLALDPAGDEPLPFVMPLPLDATTRVEMRVDGGPWMPLPRLTGAIPDAWGPGLARLGVLGLPADSQGVTEFRLLPGGDPAARRVALAQAVQQARARVGGDPVVIRERVAADLGAGARTPGADPRSGRATSPAAGQGGALPLKGRLTVRANVTGQGISVVIFRLDGRVAKITNIPPFVWEWDTRGVANGDHTLEILGKDDEGNLINRRVTRVRVEN